MKGTIVGIAGQKMTVNPDDGSANITVNVATDASVTLNGDESELTELKAGDKINYPGDPAASVSATR